MSFKFGGENWGWDHEIEICSPTVMQIRWRGQWWEADSDRLIPSIPKTMTERVEEVQAMHVALLEDNDKRWHSEAMLAKLDPIAHYFCVAYDIEQARDWNHLDLISFEDRCKWERQVRMAKASNSPMTSFEHQFLQLLADQYLPRKESRLEGLRRLEANAAAAARRKRQAEVQTQATTNEPTSTPSMPTVPEVEPTSIVTRMGQPRPRPLRPHQAATAMMHMMPAEPVTATPPPSEKTPKAGPHAIPIVAPTPGWKAARERKN